MASSQGAPPKAVVTFIIKNPAMPEGWQLDGVPVDATLQQVKELIAQRYPGNPDPSQQTLIYAGKVLKDGALTVTQVVTKVDPSGGPYNLHLVIKAPQHSSGAAASSSSSTTAAPAASSSASTSTAATSTTAATATAAALPAQAAPSAADTSATSHAAAPPPLFHLDPLPFPGSGASADPFGLGLGGTFPQHFAAPPAMPPALFLNPVVASAYQAAYAAALAAGHAFAAAQPQSSGAAEGAAVGAGAAAGEAAAGPSSSAAEVAGHTSAAAASAAATLTALRPVPGSGLPSQSLAFTQAYLASQQALVALHAANERLQQQLQAASSSSSSSTAATAAGVPPPLHQHVVQHLQLGGPFAAAHAHAPPHWAGAGAWGTLPPPPPLPPELEAHLMALGARQPRPQAPSNVVLRAGMSQQEVAEVVRLLQEGGYIHGPPRITFAADPGANIDGGVAAFLANARARARNNAAAAAQAQGAGGGQAGQQRAHAAAGQAAAAHARPRRQRVFMLRISMRTLLQILVFGMVLYQHFTWRRFITLVCIAVALWVTSLAPLRRFVASLQAPPPPPRAAAAVPAAAQPQPAAGAEGAAAAPEGAAAAGAAGAAPAAAPAPAGETFQRPRGILGEIAVIIVGFMTSLLPAWNYNPEDAAAFAAAQQEMAAGGGGGGGGGAAAAQPAPAAQQQEQQRAGAGGDGAGAAAAAAPAPAVAHEHQD